MKTLIVYYSRTGANRKAAEVLHSKITSDIEEIKEEEDRSGILGLLRSIMDAILKKTSKIKSIEKTPGNYDRVIVVTPVWAGNLPPAVRTYLNENKTYIKEIAVLSISGSGEKNKSFLSVFESAAGKKPIASLLLSERETKKKDLGELMKPLLRKIL